MKDYIFKKGYIILELEDYEIHGLYRRIKEGIRDTKNVPVKPSR